MISYYTKHPKLVKLLSLYPEVFAQVQDQSVSDLSIIISQRLDDRHPWHSNQVKFFTPKGELRNRKLIRTSRLNDQELFNDKQSTIFTRGDAIGQNIIGYPLGYNNPTVISTPDKYWLDYDQNAASKYHGQRVFWSGSKTHKSREIINDLNQFNDRRFNLSFWTPVGNDPSKQATVYAGDNKPRPQEYANYMNKLCSADAALLVRGDKTWCNSFFDLLRAGVAIFFIDTEYHNLGWHHLGYDVNKMFGVFDTDKQTPHQIYQGIVEIIEDRDRLMEMKSLARDFYVKYILTDRLYDQPWGSTHNGWADFIAGKLLQIYNNNFQLVDNCFFSPEVNITKNNAIL